METINKCFSSIKNSFSRSARFIQLDSSEIMILFAASRIIINFTMYPLFFVLPLVFSVIAADVCFLLPCGNDRVSIFPVIFSFFRSACVQVRFSDAEQEIVHPSRIKLPLVVP